MGRISALLAGAAALAAVLATSPGAVADPVKVYAAGSLAPAVKEMVGAAGLPPGAVSPSFGPAGLLRERIERGEPADLLLSADMAGPERLSRAGRLALPPVAFARNTMCLAGSKAVGLTPASALDRMLDPKLTLATSTPVADPGGDYALAVFARAEKVRAGSGSVLTTKAKHLLGSPDTMVPIGSHTPAATVFLGRNADLLLYYCSGSAALLSEVPDLVSVPVPLELEPRPVYGMAVLTTNPDALRFALFVLSERGQAILKRFGLDPLAPASAE